jgi:hypothetical protein
MSCVFALVFTLLGTVFDQDIMNGWIAVVVGVIIPATTWTLMVYYATDWVADTKERLMWSPQRELQQAAYNPRKCPQYSVRTVNHGSRVELELRRSFGHEKEPGRAWSWEQEVTVFESRSFEMAGDEQRTDALEYAVELQERRLELQAAAHQELVEQIERRQIGTAAAAELRQLTA